MNEKFRWCFIGTGRLAKQVASQLLKSGRHAIVSCYSRSYDKAQAFADKYKTKAFDNVEEAIRTEGVDAVYVVTPHNAHFRYVKTALSAGKPVLCEKAFTVSAAETTELIALAKEKDLYLCEAMWTWFSPAANKVKEWIDDHRIGKIDHADFTYHLRSINYSPRVADPKRAGGALLDITVYPLTYAYRLFGYPLNIESKGKIENGIDVSEEIVLTFADGIRVSISASITDMKGFEKMNIYGSEGRISALLYHAANRVTLHSGLLHKEVYKGPGPFINSYVAEFDIVASEIRQGLKESRYVPLSDTLAVMRIMDQIREQIGLVYDELE